MDHELPAVSLPAIHEDFAREWRAEILPARPLILPPRHFVYPREAEEVERGALEVLIHPGVVPGVIRPEVIQGGAEDRQPFLATCAVGFAGAAVPTGIWSAPSPRELCAVSGGYAYLIDTSKPGRFSMIPYRPVLEVRAVPALGLLLFVGHRSIFAWGSGGQAWESPSLSDEGLTLSAINGETLHGLGWQMMTDKETPFAVDLRTGLPTR
jgi:hypothetical protein